MSFDRSRFIELGKVEKNEDDQCCPMSIKTGESKKCIYENNSSISILL